MKKLLSLAIAVFVTGGIIASFAFNSSKKMANWNCFEYIPATNADILKPAAYGPLETVKNVPGDCDAPPVFCYICIDIDEPAAQDFVVDDKLDLQNEYLVEILEAAAAATAANPYIAPGVEIHKKP